MSNPPSPLAALTGEVHRWAAVLAGTARHLAAGDLVPAVAALESAVQRLEELRQEVLSLEPHELPAWLPGLRDAPRAGAAKLPDPGSNHLQSHLGRRQGASVDAHPDTGYADEPLF